MVYWVYVLITKSAVIATNAKLFMSKYNILMVIADAVIHKHKSLNSKLYFNMLNSCIV